MAGGPGSKLWPMSKNNLPKQFFPFVGTKSLFQHNVELLKKKYSPVDLYVTLPEQYKHFVLEQSPQLLEENIICEPEGKDSGPAVGFALLHLLEKFPNEVVNFYVQSPITRSPVDSYLDMLDELEWSVKEYKQLVTGTQIPSYIETGSDLMIFSNKNVTPKNMDLFQITDFVNVVKNRLSIKKVKEYLRNGKVGTHCNHYTWTPQLMIDSIKEIRPDWFNILMELKNEIGKDDNRKRIAQLYARFEPGRVEEVTGVLMKRGEVRAITLPYKWTHITTWEDIYQFYKKEKINLHQAKEVIEIDTENNNLIITTKEKLVATIDVKNSIIVETKDALLICPRNKANRVKKIHDILKQRGLEKYL